MQIGPHTWFFVVVDPKPPDCMVEILFQCQLEDLAKEFERGLKPLEKHVTIFTDVHEAMAEAKRRLAARGPRKFPVRKPKDPTPPGAA